MVVFPRPPALKGANWGAEIWPRGKDGEPWWLCIWRGPGTVPLPSTPHPRVDLLCGETEWAGGAGVRAGGALQALEKVAAAPAGPPGAEGGSSAQRFMQRRRAFMKKLLTVLSSRPSC